MVSSVNISKGVRQSFPAGHEYISASQTRPKYHMRFSTLICILVRLDLSLSIFIVPLDLFFQEEYGSAVLTSIWQRRMNSCSPACGPVCSP